MKDKMSRIVFAAPKSGSGKTMITCGIIEAIKRRGLKAASIKCGPDYIDPMFHRRALGIRSGNLDTFFTDEETTRSLLWEKTGDADITLIEGVMGYYDGLGGQSDRASTYELARVTQSPVLLVVDGKGASVSLAAVIKGMLEYRKDSNIKGVLLNRVSEGYYQRLKDLIEKECKVPVLGFLPDMPRLQVPSRHLGLIAPEEMNGFPEWIGKIADVMERTVDIDGLLRIAEEAAVIKGKELKFERLPKKVRLAVARDEAFSFYYTENLELLEKMGAEICFFSPLHDAGLPEAADGLILGGGYPESFGRELAENKSMRRSVREACEKGLPTLAECGGFMYLQRELRTENSGSYEMAGALSGEIFPKGKLCRFGYIEAETKKTGVFGKKKQTVRGHEFHYYDCTENGEGFTACKPLSEKGYDCMVYTKSMAAGFPHFYYYSNPGMIYQFLTACLRFQAGRLAKRRWDGIAKPIDSLGLLEDMAVRLCRIKKEETPCDLSRRALVILCGDHGVVKEGVTQTGSEVTKIVSENFAKGRSTVNYMAGAAGVDVYTVDMGMDTPCYPERELKKGVVVDRKIARGCGNIAVEPAMTLEQCYQALETGIELAGELKRMGYTVLATGEMGIGNTTPTSALAAAFLDRPAEMVTGKGAGLSREGISRKCQAVEKAVQRVKEKRLTDPAAILAEVGGYEIAGMAGVFLGGVRWEIPVVIDGAISAVAALAASRIDCRAEDFMLASHQSEEVTARLALAALGLKAPVHAGMCLGEGTGAVAVFPLLDMAMEVYRNMGTFTDYQIGAYERFEE